MMKKWFSTLHKWPKHDFLEIAANYKTNTWSTLTKNEVFISKKLIQLLQNDKLQILPTTWNLAEEDIMDQKLFLIKNNVTRSFKMLKL